MPVKIEDHLTILTLILRLCSSNQRRLCFLPLSCLYGRYTIRATTGDLNHARCGRVVLIPPRWRDVLDLNIGGRSKTPVITAFAEINR